MDWQTKVVAKYDVTSNLAALLKLHGKDKNVCVLFSNSKTLKLNMPEHYQGPAGYIGFPIAALKKPEVVALAKRAKFVHVVKLKNAEILDINTIKNVADVKKALEEIAHTHNQLGMTLSAPDVSECQLTLKKNGIPSHDIHDLFIGILRYKMISEKEPSLQTPEDQAKFLRQGAVEVIRGPFIHNLDAMVILAKQVMDVLTTIPLKGESAPAPALTEEDKAFEAQMTPSFGMETQYRHEMTLKEFSDAFDSMSNDDVAWFMAHSKHALDDGIEKLAYKRLGRREVLLLTLMNKTISKKSRTDTAEYMLDKAGVSFVGGPALERFIQLMAKKGMVDSTLLKKTNEDKIRDDIFYGGISDPKELAKFDVKKWGYQLAHNPHTPPEVLKKIAKIDGETSWSGYNPNLGGVLGKDSRYGFSKPLENPNYPINDLVETYHRYKRKYPQKDALSTMVSTLWSREDLPQDVVTEIMKERGDYSLPPPAALPKEKFLAYWEKAKTKKARYNSLEATAQCKNAPIEVLKEILNTKDKDEDGAKAEAYNRLREMNALTDEDVVKKVKKDLKFEGPDDLLKLFGLRAWLSKAHDGLKFTKVSKTEKQQLEHEMQAGSTHDDFTFDVVDAYKINRQLHKDYPEVAAQIGNVKHGLYHGTSLSNAAGILASGINVSERSRTGQMFGNGFYLASSSSKAVQYASDNFSKAGLGVVFRLSAALGNSADWKYGRPEQDNYYNINDKEISDKLDALAKEKGLESHEHLPAWHLTNDSVTARKGLALQHDEYVVKSGNQISIDLVIIVKKTPKEKK